MRFNLVRIASCISAVVILAIGVNGAGATSNLKTPAKGEYICEGVYPVAKNPVEIPKAGNRTPKLKGEPSIKTQSSGEGSVLTGDCLYRTRDYGKNTFQKLVNFAAGMIGSKGQYDPDVKIPAAYDSDLNLIRWWTPSKADNDRIGQALMDLDIPPPVLEKDKVALTLTMYSFDKSYSRDFGLDLGIFEGKAPADAVVPPNLAGSLSQGIFKLDGILGNPIASFLKVSIQAQINKSQATVMHEYSMAGAEVGENFSPSNTQKYYIQTPTTAIVETLGLTISFTPTIDPVDPTLVRLQGLLISYATETGNGAAPVNTFVPFNWSNLTMRTNQIYVAGSEKDMSDVRSGRLLGRGKETANSQFLLVMQAKVIRAGKPTAEPGFEFEQVKDVKYTDQELRALPNYSLAEILQSVKGTCSEDHVNPGTADKICGFRLEKMSAKYVNYRVQVSLDGPLPDPGKAKTFRSLGDFYNGKGYYQFPMLDNSKGSVPYQLTLQLDPTKSKGGQSNEDKRRSEEPVKGVQFSFHYYPGNPKPIDLDFDHYPELLRSLKK